MISVIIPTYNRCELARRAVASVLAQTWRDLEVIVVDDGSTDGTQAAFADPQNRVRYVRLPHSGLPAVARNAGVREARGEFLAFLDSDDEWLPEKLAAQMEVLSARPQVGLVCTNALVRKDESTKSDEMPLLLPEEILARGTGLPQLLETNFVIASTALVRRECFEAVAGFSELRALRAVGEDYDLWLRVAVKFEVYAIHEPLCIYNDVGASIRTDQTLFRHHAGMLLIFSRLRAFVRHRGMGEQEILKRASALRLHHLAKMVDHATSAAEARQALRVALQTMLQEPASAWRCLEIARCAVRKFFAVRRGASAETRP